MTISRPSTAAIAVAAVILGVGLPALAQDSPTSILPPGFGEQPAPPPVSSRPPRPAPVPSGAVTPRAPRPAAAPTAQPSGGSPDVSDFGNHAPNNLPLPGATPTGAPAVPSDPLAFSRYELPDGSRRSLDQVGPIAVVDGALPPDAFGNTDGVFLETLMRRLDAPIASRWISIGLRHALLSRVTTPAHVNGPDFAAERAWLLLRMGESIGARAMVQSVDPGNYTPKLYQIAMQAAMATGDPGALCPLVESAQAVDPEPAWVLARPICAGLSALPARVAPLFAAARRDRGVSGIDLLLAQKIAGAGASGRQDVTIDWAGVSQLTAWRYGLATAARVTIPDALYATAAPNVIAWRAQAPALDPQLRAAAAEQAAVSGVFSGDALADLYASISPDADDALAQNGVARDLNLATAGADLPARLNALKALWEEPQTADGRYGRLILTARAASRIPVAAAGADPDRLVAAMLSVGMDYTAMRWAGHVPVGGKAWALLLLADPNGRTVSYGTVGDYAPADDGDHRKQQMFFAALAGIGRLSSDDIERGAQSLDVRIGAEDSWTRALGRAALERQPATVLLLGAVGMQTVSWRGVSPETLYHVLAALRAAGLEGDARMIAAEALTRL